MCVSTACETLFSTTELLELVLLFLPEKAILVNGRVCTKWRDTVQCSRAICQKLFFEPNPHAAPKQLWTLRRWTGMVWDAHNGPEPPLNGLYLEKSGKQNSATVTAAFNRERSDETEAKQFLPITLNPLLKRKDSPSRLSGLWQDDGERVEFTFPYPLKKDESWLRMFPCDPPCRLIGLNIRWQDEVPSDDEESDFEDPNGSFDEYIGGADGLAFGDLAQGPWYGGAPRHWDWNWDEVDIRGGSKFMGQVKRHEEEDESLGGRILAVELRLFNVFVPTEEELTADAGHVSVT